MKKIILITGASSGIGFATLQKLVTEGHIVYGTARKAEDLAKINNIGGHAIELEMTDYNSIKAAISRIINEEKRIDVLFNNAGYGLYGTIEETSIEDAKKQFEVNVFSLARITQEVLPHMRAQKSGTIINTSSMGGKIYTPLGAWYHATKHALEGWSDCLRLEVKDFGIHVVIIEPGGIQTPWGLKAADVMQQISGNGPYKKLVHRTVENMRKNYGNQSNLSSPNVVANAVCQAISSRNPKTRYAVGKYAKLLIFIRTYFGDKFFDRLIRSAL